MRSILAAATALLFGSAAQAQRADTTQLQPLSIGDAARLAATQSGLAVGAHYRAEQARARALEARSALLPQASGSWADGQRTYNTASFGLPFPGLDPNGEIIGPVRTVDFRGRVVANLFDPSAFERYRSAQAMASGANADAAVVTNQAAVLATSAYVRTLRAEAQVSAHAADSSLAEDLLLIAQRQLQAGVGVALDVTRARAQVASARAALIGARNEEARARVELSRSLGLPVNTAIQLRDSLATMGDTMPIQAPAEEQAMSLALTQRAELRAAKAATDAARRALTAAKSERLPTLGVFGDDGATSNTYTHLLNTYTYGVQVTIPIFEGFRTSAHVQQQNAALMEAQARERDVQLQVSADVRSALLDVSASREQVAAARERLQLGEQELAQARERFRAGVAGNADVITAQLALDMARSQYVDALAAAEMARVSLARSQGGLLELP
jgi:outer membrane protein